MSTPNILVTFKDEGHDGREAFGPVTVVDVDAMNADPNVGPIGMPYGYKPAWREDKGWMTESAAVQVAVDHGVTLTVS